MFIPKMHAPESGNKYYNTKSAGGYSPCIVGKPTAPGCNVLANCVGYATGRFNEIIGKPSCVYLGNTNAENFAWLAQSQGLKVSARPVLGGCMVWAKGKPGVSSDGAGHVAIVEGVNPDGSIVTTDSGWNSAAWYTKQRSGNNWSQPSSYEYLGCIINPGTPPEWARPLNTVKRGMRGNAVKWVQSCLCAYGFTVEIDGRFGEITEKTLKKFQLHWGLLPDGVCGRITKDAFEKYFF